MGFVKRESLNFNFLVKNDNKMLDKVFESCDELNLSVSDGDGIFLLLIMELEKIFIKLLMNLTILKQSMKLKKINLF